MPIDSDNVGIAFALVVGAGLATALGASVVFFPSLVKLASRRVLAFGLGASAGVMTYVSFGEISVKSLDSFIEAGFDEAKAFTFATLCFFGGVAMIGIIDVLVALLTGEYHKHGPDVYGETVSNYQVNQEHAEDCLPHCIGCDPVAELEEFHRRAEQEIEQQDKTAPVSNNDLEDFDSSQDSDIVKCIDSSHCDKEVGDISFIEEGNSTTNGTVDASKIAQARGQYISQRFPEGVDNTVVFTSNNDIEQGNSSTKASKITKGKGEKEKGDKKASDSPAHNEEACNITFITDHHSFTNGTVEAHKITEGKKKEDKEEKKLLKMGLNTALAIAIHNFPEGVVTFITTLSDPRVGAVLAIAIAIHNIPEGLCVALPVYYATGSRWKGFGWALLSGITEPLAGLLCFLVLASHFTPQTFAIWFGLVSGMMVTLSIKELLPTAHRYDPLDTVVTKSFVVGMAVMALSLVLFKFSA